jgi:hypothetical protein
VNEELYQKATEYVKSKRCSEGNAKNITVTDFSKWVNNMLLPNSTMEPGSPCKVSAETTRKWLHEMAFEVLHPRKEIFIDGHEHPRRRSITWSFSKRW